jgi:O-antigen/teichoic acid export membrane protein
VFGLTAIAVIGSCVILSYFFSFMKRKEGIPISLKIPSLKTAILKILKYSIFLYLPFLSVYAIYYVLTLQLGMFSSKQNVSYFAVSMSLVTISFLLFMPISKILMPTVSRIYAQRNRDILKTMGKMLTRYIGVTSIFVSSLLCFGSMFFLRLVYGEAYTGAAPVLIVLSLAIFFETFKFITDPLLNGTKYAHAVSHVEVMKLLIVVVSGCILVPRYGALGAASAFLAGSCMSCICKLFMVRRNLDISLFGETMKIFSLFVFLVLFLSFGLSVFAYYAVYCLFVLLFRLVSPGEVRALYRLIAT